MCHIVKKNKQRLRAGKQADRCFKINLYCFPTCNEVHFLKILVSMKSNDEFITEKVDFH